MAEILVVGGGMVGSAICFDLCDRHKVTLWDVNPPSLAYQNLTVETFDILNDALPADHYFDLAVLAIPGHLGYQGLKRLMDLKLPIVDISFFPESINGLDTKAKQHDIPVIMDAGIAPGFDNLALGYWAAKSSVDSFACYVGGLPRNPEPPYWYKAPFSPIDVIEEYTRPARFRRNGKPVVMEPLTENEVLDLGGSVGELEAFNTDGLRSLLASYPYIPNMVEKTLRYKGHAKAILSLKNEGAFDSDQLEKTSQHLLEQWKLGGEEPEFTVMRIDIEEGGRKHSYRVFDERDKRTGIASMSRCTGYTCTALVEWLLDGVELSSGVHPPEYVGPEAFEYVMEFLTARGIQIDYTSID